MLNFTLLNEQVNQLVQSQVTMDQGVDLIRERLQEFDRGLESKLDILPMKDEYARFADWLTQLLTVEPIPPDVCALHFGLLESPHGVDLYVTGSSDWQPQNWKWRGDHCYVPAGKYSPTNLFTQIVKQFGTNAHLWMYLSLALVILFIRDFVASHCELFCQEGSQRLYCTTGFDEGDLFFIGVITHHGFVLS